MTVTPTRLYGPAQPASAGTQCYVAAGNVIVRHFRAVNSGTSNGLTFDVYLYASGGSASSATQLIGELTLNAGADWEDDCYIPMTTGDVLYAKAATGSTITFTVGGAVIT